VLRLAQLDLDQPQFATPLVEQHQQALFRR
jgi:hypothetical protein